MALRQFARLQSSSSSGTLQSSSLVVSTVLRPYVTSVLSCPWRACQTYSTDSLPHTTRVSPQLSSVASKEMVPERLYTKINIKVKGFDFAVLDSYMKFVITAGKALGINIGNKVALPNEVKKLTVLKSPHIYKKHRVQYEMKTHGRLVQWDDSRDLLHKLLGGVVELLIQRKVMLTPVISKPE